ncbi:hypothetical protein DSS3P8_157 [Roseobacter phage DSS3P8]|nr:hypothetical protein DSS3P8_157 [Roseobacter phage DSS3P8]
MDLFFWVATALMAGLLIVRHIAIEKTWTGTNPYELTELLHFAGTPIKLWLDDERPAPRGWVRVYRADDVVRLLSRYPVEAVSLDHDLGNGLLEGYHVMQYLENEAYAGREIPKEINIHTSNPPARQRMEAALVQIERFRDRNVAHPANTFHINRH